MIGDLFNVLGQLEMLIWLVKHPVGLAIAAGLIIGGIYFFGRIIPAMKNIHADEFPHPPKPTTGPSPWEK